MTVVLLGQGELGTDGLENATVILNSRVSSRFMLIWNHVHFCMQSGRAKEMGVVVLCVWSCELGGARAWGWVVIGTRTSCFEY